uniref:AAA+ ATPase domain-containing protein n=1 Tax=Helicotheca tamesis TaxID=374047 RepID=A0A7S2I8H2_9STRA|mmetsp:Transcript_6868/g.9254  ORF Transcript_6868/g.9254 Transcript_6868/m.9254 type:complete len:412 (+) Transcript_6868:93-1328(+)|eukprot:CAMPEP_0185728888 /NCGR_PEP_ID=MMETSP1171-20130828/4289_1 /TAXON_ID=374046 /ORGANISM="Helicotheca tamensis, Strain CCMP826" /LENGTH=411 /DNA_ID=CAMNT_0028397637 /DNA_START=89 /DNA_END=1324 /DNA_ORIENTATION=+
MKLAVCLSALCISSASAFVPSSFGASRASTSLYSSNQNPFGAGQSLEYTGGDDPNNKNYVKLADALNVADTERRKAEEEALARERAAEMRREERLRKIQYMADMPDDQPAGTVDEFMFKEGVQDQLDKLDNDLVGLVPVKKRVKEIAALLVLDKMRRKLGFETSVPSLHMSFTGAPGTGKTTVAVRMGQILAKMGYSRRGHVVLATRDDLVGQYVGHTAPKTKEMIKKAMGGLLLVDEAYYLYNAANDRDYGQECIEILLNVMENNQDDLVVAVAGYKDRMDKFFSYIPGMMSRIGNHIDFPNYNSDELVKISSVMARDLEYDIDPNAYPVFQHYIEERMQLPYFSNARTVRNAMDRARMNSAIRTFERFAINGENGGMCTVEDLRSIQAADFQVLLDDILNADTDKRIFA